MTIYVDEPMPRGGQKFQNWCHLWSSLIDDDPLAANDELISFAIRLGLKTKWAQNADAPSGPFPHFDISPTYRRIALAHGAKPMRLAGWIKQRPGWKHYQEVLKP